MTLAELVPLLERFVAAEIPLDQLRAALAPTLASDPLDVARSDAEPWARSPDEERLKWRLVYLAESDTDAVALRDLLSRVVRCLGRTRSAADTHEMLPLLADQRRLATIVERHERGIISRTAFLSVLAEAGYPAHVKRWLERADLPSLVGLVGMLEDGDYDVALGALERPAR